MAENTNIYHELGQEIGEALRNATNPSQPSQVHVDSSPFAAAMAAGMQRTREVLEHQNEVANAELRDLITAFVDKPDSTVEIDLKPIERALTQLVENRQDAISDAQVSMLAAAIEAVAKQLARSMDMVSARLSDVETALLASKTVRYDRQGRIKQVDVKMPS